MGSGSDSDVKCNAKSNWYWLVLFVKVPRSDTSGQHPPENTFSFDTTRRMRISATSETLWESQNKKSRHSYS